MTKMFGTTDLRHESILSSMIRDNLGILCAVCGAVFGYVIGGFEIASLGILMGFFLGKTVDSMLRAVDVI